MEITGAVAPQEVAEKVLSIKSADKLAKELGFVRNENVTERWYREFVKQISEGGKFVTLAFQNGKYGGGQRIILGIKPEETSERNEVEHYLCQDNLFDEQIKELGLTVNADRMFVRSELENGGYLKLYYFLRGLEEGRWNGLVP